jgi:signal peptidase II
VKKHKDKLFCLLICVAAIVADQITKSAVRSMMDARGGQDLVLIPGFLSIIQSYNQGIAFGMFQGIRFYILFIPIMAAVFVLFFVVKEGMRDRWMSIIGLGMLLGGAIGNMVDRMRVGQVFDFIKAYHGNLQWPTFNVADSFILVGFVLFAFVMFRSGGPDE